MTAAAMRPADAAPNPGQQNDSDAHVGEGSAIAFWAAFLSRLLARSVLLTIATMVFWAALPALFGWHATTVMSDSMAPRVLRGDVVVSLPVAGDRVKVGQVALFDDPDHAGRLRFHRVIRVDADHVLTTKGDANASADSSSVQPAAVRGVGVLRVPYIAYPIVWLREGDLLPLGLVGAAVAGLIVLALPSAAPRRARRARRATGSPARVALVVGGVIAVGALAVAAATPAHAAFSSQAATSTSSLSAADSFVTTSSDVTAAQLGISAGAGTSLVSATVPVDSTGTISSPYYVCTTVQVTTASSSAEDWQIKVKYTMAPFNSVPPSSWNFQQNGATTGRVISGPDADGYVYIGGAGTVDSTHPFGSTDWSTSPGTVYNTPVGPSQTATVYFCATPDQNHLAPIVPAVDTVTGAANYTVSAPQLVGDGAGAPTAYYACAAVTVTGLYPHFWVGYRFSVDWTALLQSARAAGTIDAATQTALAAKTLGTQWAQSSGPSATAVAETAPATPGHAVYDVTSTGLGPTNGAVTDGTAVTVRGCTS